MAAMSEAKIVSNSNIVPSHVSSNGYYGYVPLIGQFPKNSCEYTCKHDNNHASVYLHENLANTVVCDDNCQKKQILEDNCCFDNTLAMETDDDVHEHYRNGMLGICCQNNHCVIPEIVNGGKEHLNNGTMVMGNAEGIGFYQQHQSYVVNRKRSNTDNEINYGQPAGMKKFKHGGGNGLVSHGPGITREQRSSQMHNDSSSLCIASMKLRTNWYKNIDNNCCKDAAGNCYNCHLIDNQRIDCNKLICNKCTNVHYTDDYEKMLMETHGCTIYHHQRQDIDNGTDETEF